MAFCSEHFVVLLLAREYCRLRSILASLRTVSVNTSDLISLNGHKPHPTIVATATALPPYRITRDDVKYYFGRVFEAPERRVEAMMSSVHTSQVRNRHSIFPTDYTINPR